MRELTVVLKELTLDLRTLILFEEDRRDLTIDLRTLILFEEGRRKLTLGLRVLTLGLRIDLKIIGEDMEIVNLAPNWQSSIRA